MICRRCLQRASSGLSRRVVSSAATSAAAGRQSTPFLSLRALSTSLPRLDAPADQQAETPTFSTPLADSPPSPEEAAVGTLSACPAGTVLTGLNYFKNQTDPVALTDDKYPEWLWRCLDVQKKASDATADDAADEFSKSKKQRRLAAKRQRALEARLMAEGNLEALAPKIPLQQQSINMPGNEDGTPEGAVAAAAAREDLRKAMRKERKAKIKESNYLKSM
ncbi:hypothetical protein PG991_004372 [Apiospora marii]|uniref:Large ribosomal subunit protein mL54 n=1 Tax=Apiospora marii TaxID=335849 RepID=A0ABR1S6J1_9PEZI